MSRVVASVVVSDEGTTERRIMISVTLEDNNLVQTSETIGPVMIEETADAALIAAEKADILLASKLEVEDETLGGEGYADAGIEPLTLVLNPQWSTDRRIARRLILWMMRERDPRIVIFLEPLIDYIKANYTAQQIATWLNITIAQVLKMNDRINAILEDAGTVKAQILVFDGTLEEIE